MKIQVMMIHVLVTTPYLE
jgi:arsenate reductase-like glutaredoxin family protein